MVVKINGCDLFFFIIITYLTYQIHVTIVGFRYSYICLSVSVFLCYPLTQQKRQIPEYLQPHALRLYLKNLSSKQYSWGMLAPKYCRGFPHISSIAMFNLVTAISFTMQLGNKWFFTHVAAFRNEQTFFIFYPSILL